MFSFDEHSRLTPIRNANTSRHKDPCRIPPMHSGKWSGNKDRVLLWHWLDLVGSQCEACRSEWHSSVILSVENGATMCHHYWPVEGSARFNDFEVKAARRRKHKHTPSCLSLLRSISSRNISGRMIIWFEASIWRTCRPWKHEQWRNFTFSPGANWTIHHRLKRCSTSDGKVIRMLMYINNSMWTLRREAK